MLENVSNCFWYGIIASLVSIIIGLWYIIFTSLYLGPASVSIPFVEYTEDISGFAAIFAVICLLLGVRK